MADGLGGVVDAPRDLRGARDRPAQGHGNGPKGARGEALEEAADALRREQFRV